MKLLGPLLFVAFGLATTQSLFVQQADAAERLPHVVLIMADDLGYGDTGCFNPMSKIPTPNIDLLAREGMRFTDAHAPASLCVETRYGLLTGSYPFRMGRKGRPLIEPDQLTIGRLLGEKGYHTACVGKWHLGFTNEKNPAPGEPLEGGPVDSGFDRFFGIPASLDIPPYYYIADRRAVAVPSLQIEKNNSPGVTPIQGAFWRAGGIAPGFHHVDVVPQFAKTAVEFVKSHQANAPDKPMFLYLALPSPHTPWLPLPAFQGSSQAGDYGDFTVQVDDVIGQVLQTLDSLGMADDTLVFFTSDNGPVWYAADVQRYGHSSTHIYRGMKGDVWEGGHRMPFIARWPNHIRAQSVNHDTICHTDLLATLAGIVDRPLADGEAPDSYSMLSSLLERGRNESVREAMIHQPANGKLAIRKGQWKLIPQLGSAGFSKPRIETPETGGPQGQLYNLAVDPGEQNNRYAAQPKIVAELTELLAEYRSSKQTRP